MALVKSHYNVYRSFDPHKYSTIIFYNLYILSVRPYQTQPLLKEITNKQFIYKRIPNFRINPSSGIVKNLKISREKNDFNKKFETEY